ncbi:uncharacterized protein METZ01_LOCUS329720, partial [marine metagenome]
VYFDKTEFSMAGNHLSGNFALD